MTEQPHHIESSLRFEGYMVNRVVFELNPSFTGDTAELAFTVERQVELALPELSVTLAVDVFPNAAAQNYPFSMSLNVTGFFMLEGEGADTAQQLAEMNAVAILYPYIRALATTYTANANITPLILPTINVVKMLEG
ncbi:MAG TPA: protein-export chaperone SecB [Armatimonadota bacterium]|jgi:preprotein translocase subunit SecB